MRVSSPTATRTVAGIQGPVPRRRRTFQEQRATDLNRSACAPIRFRDDARDPGGFTLHDQLSWPPMRGDGQEMAEDGELESHGS